MEVADDACMRKKVVASYQEASLQWPPFAENMNNVKMCAR